MGKGNIKNYFPGGNTPEGFFSYYKYLPFDTKRTFIIKGGPGTGKSTFMKRIGIELNNQGYDIEFHWCSSDNDSLDGLVIPGLSITIFDGTAPHMLDPVYPGAVEEIINVGAFWDSQYLQANQENIVYLTNLIKRKFQQVYRYLKAAKYVYEDWKEYYTRILNFNRVNQKVDEIIMALPFNKEIKEGAERHLFASAVTPEGPVDYFANLINGIENIYYLIGHPGTGKSTLIKKITVEAKKKGHFIICLHRPFEPAKMDGIIIPELNTALITTSPPFKIKIASPNRVINMEECLNADIMEYIQEYKEEISETEKVFNKLVSQASRYLKLAKKTHDALEGYYIKAMDFNGLEETRKDFIQKILP